MLLHVDRARREQQRRQRRDGARERDGAVGGLVLIADGGLAVARLVKGVAAELCAKEAAVRVDALVLRLQLARRGVEERLVAAEEVVEALDRQRRLRARRHGAVELCPGDALLDNGMGACLHENMGASGVGHVAQQGLQAECVGRGVGGGNHAVHDAVLHGANQPGFSVEQSVKLVEQGHGGGFAIGARYGDHLHVM